MKYICHRAAGGSDMLDLKQVGDKKASKPLMEKRRRARINHCLAQLKSIIIDPNATEGTRQTKLEKADILEMTVRHLHEIKRRQRTALALSGSHPKKKFQIGYSECAREVDLFLSNVVDSQLVRCDDGLQQRLRDHLSNRLQQFQCEPSDDEARPFVASPQPVSTSIGDENVMLPDSSQDVALDGESKLSKFDRSDPEGQRKRRAPKYTCSDFVKLEILKSLAGDQRARDETIVNPADPRQTDSYTSRSLPEGRRSSKEYPGKNRTRTLSEPSSCLTSPDDTVQTDAWSSSKIYHSMGKSNQEQNSTMMSSVNYQDPNTSDGYRCYSDAESPEMDTSDYPQDLTTSGRFPDSVHLPTSCVEYDASSSNSDSGIGVTFQRPPHRNQKSGTFYELSNADETALPSPPGHHGPLAPPIPAITGSAQAQNQKLCHQIVPLIHSPSHQGLMPEFHAGTPGRNSVDHVAIKPRRLRNGDWALVVPHQYLVPTNPISNPFSAFRVVWPSAAVNSDSVQYRQQYDASPLSSTVSDMSAEEYNSIFSDPSPPQEQGHIQCPETDEDGSVWRPW